MQRRYAQVNLNLFGDPKVLRLARLVDEVRFYAALGAYLETVLRSWQEGERVPAEAPDQLVQSLKDVRLLTDDGLVGEKAWRTWFVVEQRRERDRERKRAQRAAVLDDPDNPGQPGTTRDEVGLPLSHSHLGDTSDATGGAPGGDGLAVYRWLAKEVGYVDPLGGLGLQLAQKVQTLGQDEVLRRLAHMHASGSLDPGDTAGYIFGITDRFRRRAPVTDQDELDTLAEQMRKEARGGN